MQLRALPLVLAGHLALAGCHGSPAAPGAATPAGAAARGSYAQHTADALAFLPVDAEIVLGLDLRQVVKSPVWKRFEPQFAAVLGNKLSEFKAKCGYDPFETLGLLTMGIKLGAGDQPDGVVVVRGVDRDKTLACLPQAYPSKQATYADGFVTFAGSAGDPPGVMTFADASTAVVQLGAGATRAGLEAALAAGVPLRGSTAFTDLWGQIDAKQTAWVVLNGNAKMFDALSQLGSRPRAVVGSISLVDGLSASGRIRFETPEQAAQLASMAQGAIGGFQAMFSRLEVAADGAELTLLAVMTPEQLVSLFELAGGALGGP